MSASTAATAVSSTFANYILLNLRVGSLRARLAANEFQFVVIALKGGFISPTAAMEHLAEAGVLDLIIPSSGPLA